MSIYEALNQLDQTVEQDKPGKYRKSAPAKNNTSPSKSSVKPSPTRPLRSSKSHDVTTDVMTPELQSDAIRLWRETIQDTETLNSALRLTAEERDRVEDLVRDLRRKHNIKTSMNELARLGLLMLEHDLRANGARSVIHSVKKA